MAHLTHDDLNVRGICEDQRDVLRDLVGDGPFAPREAADADADAAADAAAYAAHARQRVRDEIVEMVVSEVERALSGEVA